ncbi:MAG: ATP-binding cassette domain-containing protein [Flavobacteriales bacterium]
MKIILDGIGKRYRANWLFRDLKTELITPQSYMITGYNGSGKSTLLLIMAGFVTPTMGKIEWINDDEKQIEREKVYEYFSLCSPSLELFDDLSLAELVERHFSFRPMLGNYKVNEFKEICGLDAHWNKQVGTFSSGMKQRVKIALAVLTESKALLLDEPAMNLDTRSVDWYYQLIHAYLNNRLLVVATNNPQTDSPFKATEINIVQRS